MSNKNVTLKEKVNGVLGDTLFPATITPNVYDSAKSQALSQTLVDTPDYEALGYAKFSTARSYEIGEKCYEANKLYKFTANKSAGEWDSSKVESWSVEQDIEAFDEAIRELIPAQASADNKLADKEYVNDKVATDTATFRGTFNLVTDLELTTEATQGQIATALGTAISGEDKNDYAYVQIPTSDATPTEIARIDRYKYTGLQWQFEYSLNNSGFTAEQWAAINSGITSSLVTAFGAKYDKPVGGIPVSDMDTSTFDAEPTEDSAKPAKSGGIWSWVSGLINGIREWASGTFAKIDGWYKTLVAGAAENLVGHGSVSAEYTFRTSAGPTDIGTGTATIDIMKGKTLKWNQLMQNGNFANGTTGWVTNNVSLAVTDGVATLTVTTGSQYWQSISQSFAGVEGHKYLVAASLYPSADRTVMIALSQTSGSSRITQALTANKWTRVVGIGDTHPTQINVGIVSASADETVQVKDIICIDLTLMFGAGNEPSTVAEFEALYPLDYYAYTSTPVLINNAASGIVTTGFNQWDEQWESGRISDLNGGNITGATAIRSKNYIPVFGGVTYYFKKPSNISQRQAYYDADKNFISFVDLFATSGVGGTFTTPSNARYMRFYVVETTYNNDICINLSWSGYRNGEYEPYEKHTLYFNGENGSLATVTGKKLVSGVPTGESEIVWVDGMKGIGTAFDFGKVDSDGYIRVGNRVFGVVDLGDLDYTYDSNSSVFYTPMQADMIRGTNLLCAIYTTKATGTSSSYGTENMVLWLHQIGVNMYIKNSSYTDKDTFKAAMSGVKLYYQKVPEEYLLDTPIPATYIVNDFGTEQRIPEDTASSVMAPIAYDVKYSMNAVDTLRRLPVNYISKDSMEQYLAARGTLDGGTWSMSWDSEHERYNFTFTATEEQQQEGE